MTAANPGPQAPAERVDGGSAPDLPCHVTPDLPRRPSGPARWPLLLLALPAVVAIWSGWVGLGGMCGFGPVTLLPGISPFRVNTAVTLPVGMEVYAAYALRAWLARGASDRAARFARRSALSALGLGAAGQIAYHLMAAAGWREAPWPVTIAVACVPVAVLGMGAALAHLLAEPSATVLVVEAATLRQQVAEAVAEALPEPVPALAAEPAWAADELAEPARGTGAEPEVEPGRPAVEPAVEPAQGPVRLALADRPAAVEPAEPAESGEPRRYACDCGCGRSVPKATRSRHRRSAREEAAG